MTKATKAFHFIDRETGRSVHFAPGDEVPDDIAARVGRHVLDAPQPHELPAPEPETRPNGVPTAQNIADRRDRWGNYAPQTVLHRSHVPAALAHIDVFKRLQKDREAVRVAEASLNSKYEDWKQRTQLAKDRHAEAKRDAMLGGTEPPGPLQLEPWLYEVWDRSTWDGLHEVIEAEEIGLLRERRNEWLDLLEMKLAPVLPKIEKALQALEKANAEAAPIRSAMEALGQPLDSETDDFGARVSRVPAGDPKSFAEVQRMFDDSRKRPGGLLAGRR